MYPGKPQAVTPENSRPAERAHGPRVLLSTADAKWQVRCGDSALSVHVLSPYPGWELFYDRIHHALRIFLNAATPKTVAQINLRYRNKILIPAQSLLMGDYFTLGTTIPHGLPTRFVSYVTGIRAAYEDEPRNVLSLSFTATPPEREAKHAVEAILDIMVSRIQLNEPAEPDVLLDTVRDLQAKAYDAFEKLITDHTRKLFA